MDLLTLHYPLKFISTKIIQILIFTNMCPLQKFLFYFSPRFSKYTDQEFVLSVKDDKFDNIKCFGILKLIDQHVFL